MKTILLSTFILLSFLARAQQPVSEKFFFSVHAGYANMVNGTGGLTDMDPAYEKDICKGIAWDAQCFFAPRYIGVGLLYSGFSSRNSTTESSDHVYTHYIAPQLTVYFIRREKGNMRLVAGAGYLVYRNDGTVFEKKRYVTGGNMAGNVGLSGEVNITPSLGASLEVQYVFTSLGHIRPHYHNESLVVQFPDRLHVSRINISAGLTYHF